MLPNSPIFYSSQRSSTLVEAGDQKFVFDAGPLELGEDLMEIDGARLIDVRKPATSGEGRGLLKLLTLQP